jgi:hypothetical protein
VRHAFDSLYRDFEALQLAHHIHDAVLIGVTDDEPVGYFQEIPNSDGFFQVLIGMGSASEISALSEGALRSLLYVQIRKGILACPFSDPDRQAIDRLLSAWAASNLAAL